MFTIYGGKTEFNQWDLEQLVTCSCLQEGDKVVFSGFGKAYETTAFVQDGQVWADVPNFLMQEPGYIRVDLGWGLDCHMDCRTTFTVVAKDKPVDYVCPYNIKPRANNSGGGVSSWNDLTDKPFYEETQTVEVLAECQPSYVESEGMFLLEGVLPDLIAGETYIVTWNDTEYTCIAQDLSVLTDGGLSGVSLGNLSEFGGIGNNEPFATVPVDDGLSIVPLDGSTSVTLSIRQEQTVVRKLDNKYLDLAWLPVDNLTPVTLYDGSIHLNTNKNETLTEPLFDADIIDGEQYTVTWDGTEYKCNGHNNTITAGGQTAIVMYIGNASLSMCAKILGFTEDTGEPFVYEYIQDGANTYIYVCGTVTNTDVAMKVVGYVPAPNQMPTKFLPDGVPYAIGGLVEILPEYTIASEEDLAAFPALGLVEGNTYIVKLNGAEYTCVAWAMTDEGATAVGLGDIYTATGGSMGTEATGEPFVLIEYPPEVAAQMGMNVAIEPIGDISLPITVSIIGDGAEIRKLDNRCLDLAWLPTSKLNIVIEETTVENNGTLSGFTIDDGYVAGTDVVVVVDGVEYFDTVASIELGASTIFYVGNLAVSDASMSNTGEPFCCLVNVGQFVFADGASHKVSIGKYAPDKMPAEFLPEDATVFYLTSPGGKKFAVTVSDDGTLSAAEVTA